MLPVDARKITKADLQKLIDNQVFEDKELEYKDYSFAEGKLPDKQRDKFMKEIAAFANTNGGTIIVGIQEGEDRQPTLLSGTHMSLDEFDNWLSSFRQLMLSRIRPHLHGVECIPVVLDDNNVAIVISVPKSFARPHSFWDGNKDEFFMRYANGIMYMDIDDLRKEFLRSYGLQDKIREFRRNRISLILANECVGNLGNDAKIVFHIIPEWSFELGNTINFSLLDRNTSVHPLSGSSWNSRYNADGYCIFGSDYSTGAINTYTQFFHSGIIEATEIRLVSKYKKKTVYDWQAFQSAIIEKLIDYGHILEELRVPKPWYISASILNAKGYIAESHWIDSMPLERDIINSLDGMCTEDISLESSLRPVFDSLSNAFGFSGSSHFQQ